KPGDTPTTEAPVEPPKKDGPAPPPKNDNPNTPRTDSLPKELVLAWDKAGAEYGWCEVYASGGMGVTTGVAPAGSLPGFRINKWKDGMLNGLPHPEVPFALEIQSEMSEAGAKEL